MSLVAATVIGIGSAARDGEIARAATFRGTTTAPGYSPEDQEEPQNDDAHKNKSFDTRHRAIPQIYSDHALYISTIGRNIVQEMTQ